MDALLQTALSYETYVSEQLNSQADQSALRYVFCPFDKMLIFSPTGIPPLEAGRIHLIPHLPQVLGLPYLQLYFRERPFDPKEVNYNPATQSGEIRISPAPIVDQLTSVYGAHGAIQVTSLFNLPARAWQALDLNGLIFESKTPTKPEEYLAQFDRVRERVAGMKASGERAEFVEQTQRLIPRILAELEASVFRANGWAKQKAEEFNAARANGELKRFSPFERKVFEFASVTPHDQALNEMAVNQNAAISALPALVESLLTKQQAAQPTIDWKAFGQGVGEAMTEKLKELGVVAPAKPEEPKKGGKQ
ncbi:MAG TPA: hypothetical protein PKC13_24245 [Blastocatellia bacterium]|nr:hypothetical protein [Blastocatellia bacterium]HMX28719.1 hypothetical protein [Blastocatellia bacterium]HMY71189.1 hypothetical protein [Blastocatellia bacterium]